MDENAVHSTEQPAHTETQTSPDPEPERRKSTSSRPSLHHHASSPFPVDAPVLGAVGWIGEPLEKATSQAIAFKHHPIPTVTQHGEHDPEKGHSGNEVVDDQAASAATTATIVGEETTESEREGDGEIIYPGGFQLAMLTLGLCLATFTVALGE